MPTSNAHVISNRSKLLVLAATVLCSMVSSGCALVSWGIGSYHDAGLSEQDRQVLLTKEIKQFHQVLFFGNVDVAMTHVEDEARAEISPRFVHDFKSEKFVDHSIDATEFNDAAREAVVHLTVKYFKSTNLLVKERQVIEHWKFSTGGIWKLLAYDSFES